MKKFLLILTLSFAMSSTCQAKVWETTCSNCHGKFAPSRKVLLQKFKTPEELVKRARELVIKGVMPKQLPFGLAAKELYGRTPKISYQTKMNKSNKNKYTRFFSILPSTPPIPEEDPMTVEKIKLGKMLYFDPRLSRSKLISCNTCHNLSIGGDDNQKTSIGDKWQHGPRNAPTVFNAAFLRVQFWDGRASTLEEQAKGPLTAHVEMNATPEMIVERLRSIPEYKEMFKKAFPGEKNPITFTNVAKAIATYERTLITPNSPFDKYLAGDKHALSKIQVEGLKLFVDKGCVNCHRGPVLSDGLFHKFKINNDKGRYNVTKNPADMYKFRTPQLRNVAETAPYFHDGSVENLTQAVKIMGRKMLKVNLTNSEAYKIRKFLESLTGQVPMKAVVLPIIEDPAK
ncbi:cytochrome-c peroxidase [Desulfurobacterium sp.]|uniref:cytochrome-c peroxidase n=1 Tax=Desulfurobacterium sp. TaxID=2004706 RepID=UPI00260A46CD|nr:cytochrome-c peroxidase [Desulfurobacterium sp.]